MQSEGAILEGDLARISLPDVLTFVAMIRHNGKLVLHHGEFERSIYWHQGEIVFATSNSFEQSLGQFLLRNGKITEKQYVESRERLTPGTRHGKLLIQMGAISPKDLWWGVKNHTLEIIYSLFTWSEGRFVFHDTDEELQERITLSLNSSSIIMEGIRRIDESARIRERIPSTDLVFVRLAHSEPDLRHLDLAEPEMKVFEHIDGSRSVRDLVRLSELTEFEVSQLLFQLLSARLIEEVLSERGPRAVFLDVEDSPELLKIIASYNDMFARLHFFLAESTGDDEARRMFAKALGDASNVDFWSGITFDQLGRFDENMLLANISELPFERRKFSLDEGLNTLLSIQLFEVSQHLDATSKLAIFRFIAEKKAELESQIQTTEL